MLAAQDAYHARATMPQPSQTRSKPLLTEQASEYALIAGVILAAIGAVVFSALSLYLTF